MVLEYMPIRSFAVNIRSIRLMALNTLVSLSRKITFAMKAGILVDMACGRMMYSSTSAVS